MSDIHRIEYSPLPDFKTKIYLAPLTPVTLCFGAQEFSGFALVDSGAGNAVISTVIAEELGIEWDKIPVTQGASAGGLFRSHRLGGLKVEIFDHEFQLSVSIVEALSPYRFILGQADLFHQAKVTFEEYKKQFTVEFRKLN